MSAEQTLTQIKVLLLECMLAETNLAKFLTRCAQRYGQLLTPDEREEGSQLTTHVSEIVEKIVMSLPVSDDSYHPKDSDDKPPPDIATVYPPGGVTLPSLGVACPA